MADAPVLKGIKNSWTLLAFAKEHGKMQVGDFTTIGEDGNKRDFKSCIFTNKDGERVFVAFSSNLGVLTPLEIVKRKDELQVVELESGSFILCAQGDNAWEDVDL